MIVGEFWRVKYQSRQWPGIAGFIGSSSVDYPWVQDPERAFLEVDPLTWNAGGFEHFGAEILRV